MFIWRKRVDQAWFDRRADEFERRFWQSIAIIRVPNARRATIEISCPSATQAQALFQEFGGAVEKLRPGWLKGFQERGVSKLIRIGARLKVQRSADPDSNRRQTIVIPAEAAFGTGEHATTAMSLRMLERVTRHLPPGWTMLDAGTGSGVLALAGSCFGAKRIVAIDLDPLACATAKRNARSNRIRNIQFVNGDVLKLKVRGKFDVITANLFSEILIDALPAWSRHLAPGGWLILSGILRSQERAMRRALKQNRFEVSEIRRRGKWIALLAFPRTAQRAVPTRKKS